MLDPVAGIDGVHDVVIRDGRIAELAAPGAAVRGRRRGRRRRGPARLPGLLRPPRPPAHPRPRAQGGRRDRHPRRRRRRLSAASSRWPTPSRRSRPRPTSRRCARRPARGASVPVGFLATVTRGMEGEELTEMVELREAGALGFSDDGLPIRSARDHAPGAPVPAPLRRHDRPARGGPRALRATASCTRARSRPRSAWPASPRSRSRR